MAFISGLYESSFCPTCATPSDMQPPQTLIAANNAWNYWHRLGPLKDSQSRQTDLHEEVMNLHTQQVEQHLTQT